MALKKLFALLVCACFPAYSSAVTLKHIEVSSYLGQPLEASIKVTTNDSSEIDSLRVGIASSRQFVKREIPQPGVLSQLRFRIHRRGPTEATVFVTTARPINEPFLDFLVEAKWAKGQAIREYTLLLDPPTVAAAASTPPTVAPAKSVSKPKPQKTRKAAVKPPQTKTAKKAPSSTPKKSQLSQPARKVAARPKVDVGEDGVRVRRGNTLWQIASRTRPKGASIQQAIQAIYRANQDAFISGNANLLKQGVILRIPPEEEIIALDKAASERMLAEHTRAWRVGTPAAVGRETGVAEVAQAPAEKEATKSAAAEEATDTTTSPGAAKDKSSDRLMLASAGASAAARNQGDAKTGEGADADAGGMTAEQEVVLAREELASIKQERKDLTERLTDLESQLKDARRLIELKDEQLARLQAFYATQGADAQTDGQAADAAADNNVVSPQTLPAEKVPEVSEDAGTQDVVSETAAMPAESVDKAGATAAPSDDSAAMTDKTPAAKATESEESSAAQDAEQAPIETTPEQEPVPPKAESPADETTPAEQPEPAATKLADVDTETADDPAVADGDTQPEAASEAETTTEKEAEAPPHPVVAETQPEKPAETETPAGMPVSPVAKPSAEAPVEKPVVGTVAASAETTNGSSDLIGEIAGSPYFPVVGGVSVAALAGLMVLMLHRRKNAQLEGIEEVGVGAYGDATPLKEVGVELGDEPPAMAPVRHAGEEVAESETSPQDDDFEEMLSSLEERLGVDEDLRQEAVSELGQTADTLDTESIEGRTEPELEAQFNDLPTELEAEAVAEEIAQKPDIDGLDSLEFEVPAVPSQTDDEAKEEATFASEDAIDFDLGQLGLTANEALSSEPEELTEEDSELGQATDNIVDLRPETQPSQTPTAMPAAESEEEVETKLDLARAFLDLGDNEGAKSILEEVVAEGNNRQRQEAETLMSDTA